MNLIMNAYDEYMLEDTSVLFSEETLMFMENASAPVKKSFLQKMVSGLKALFTKISDMSKALTQKFSSSKAKKIVSDNPELKNKKVKRKKYEEALKLGDETTTKIKKAKSTKEVKKITTEYKSKRKKILGATIGVTVGALVVGGGIFAAHKYLKPIKQDIEVLSGTVEGYTIPRRYQIGTSKGNGSTIYAGGPVNGGLPEYSSASRDKAMDDALKRAVYGTKKSAVDFDLDSARFSALATVNNDMLNDIKGVNTSTASLLNMIYSWASNTGVYPGHGFTMK